LEVISTPVESGQQTPVTSLPSSSRITLDNPGPSTSDPGVTLRALVRDRLEEFTTLRTQRANLKQVRAFLVSSLC
jgi:hypothetical protein